MSLGQNGRVEWSPAESGPQNAKGLNCKSPRERGGSISEIHLGETRQGELKGSDF